ncbi:hypothetical protein V8G54_017341, partial [Vigna mungo]
SFERFLCLQQRYLWRAPEARHCLLLRTCTRALPRLSPTGEFLHRDNREYLAGGSSAHGEDMRRRTAFSVGGGEAIGGGEAEAVGEEQSGQPRSDRRVRCGACSGSTAPVQRSVDAGARGHGVAESVSSGGEQGADNECWRGEVADLRA